MFVAALNDSDISRLEVLAGEIWREHYTPIIGAEQVEYMLTNFHSPEAIKRDIDQPEWHYYFIHHQNDAVGYIGYKLQADALFLSKLYLHSKARGLGLGRKAMEFVLEKAKAARLDKVSLTVNKYNHGSIHAYEKMGFEKVEEIVVDIGGGYVMDDYRMELSLN